MDPLTRLFENLVRKACSVVLLSSNLGRLGELGERILSTPRVEARRSRRWERP